MRMLQTKVQSAQKGYAFGCTSITGDPLLSQFCPGKDKCTWLTEQIQEKKRKGLIIPQARFPNLADIVEDNGKVSFILLKDGVASTTPNMCEGQLTYEPPLRDQLPFSLPRAHTDQHE
jgi:hypothetical protein